MNEKMTVTILVLTTGTLIFQQYSRCRRHSEIVCDLFSVVMGKVVDFIGWYRANLMGLSAVRVKTGISSNHPSLAYFTRRLHKLQVVCSTKTRALSSSPT